MLNFIDVSPIIAETEDIDKLPTSSSRPEDKNGDLVAINQANASSILNLKNVLIFLSILMIAILVSKLVDQL